MFTFLHLSDIHFSSRQAGSVYELNQELRNELEIDAEELASEVGGYSAVLISGDIAYSGKPEQFEKAAEWLQGLCARVGVPQQEIYTVPGNHDVDRDLHRDNRGGRLVREQLRGSSSRTALDDGLEDALGDATSASYLLEPLRAYNDFAASFGCEVSADRPFWEAELDLDHGYRLGLRGANSALVSDGSDNEDSAPLVIGTMQSQLPRRAGLVHAVICHHPSNWILFGADAKSAIAANGCLHLSGHIHEYGLEVENDCVFIAAGALHPNRGGLDGPARYNAVSLGIAPDDPPTLKSTIHLRVWDEGAKRFVADARSAPGGISSMAVRLDSATALPTEEPPIDQPEAVNDPTETYEAESVPDRAQPITNRRRRLVYRLSMLPLAKRRAAAAEIGLTTGDVAQMRPSEFPRAVVKRAEDTERLAALWDEVERLHGSPSGPANPYRDSEIKDD